MFGVDFTNLTLHKKGMSIKRNAIKVSGQSKGQLIAGNGTPLLAVKFNANDKCRCGSGKKTKRCCGTYGGYRNSKPNPDAEAGLAQMGYKTIEP